jgi:hypothetical protein
MQNLIDNSKQNALITFLNVNVILTFESFNSIGESQEFFDLLLPIKNNEISAINFLNNNLFHQITDACKNLNRPVEDLSKISTASNWDLFETTTNLDSLPSLGHSCKWFFGNGRTDLDEWELDLINKYRFGINLDMSWIYSAQLTQHYLENMSMKRIEAMNQSK